MQEQDLIETRAVLDTPEGVQLTFQLAGPGLRLGAYLIDLAVRAAIVLIASILLRFTSFLMPELSMGVLMVLMFLLEWFYGTIFEWLWSGRTPGKRAMKIRVIKDGGYPIGFMEAVMRNFLRAADAMFVILYAIGLSVMMASNRMKRLGDYLAGTMVVVDQTERVRFRPRNLQMVPVLLRSECRRGFHVSERTLDVISRLFERTGYLSGPRREAIAIVLAEPIADRLGFDLHSMREMDRGSRFLIRVIKTFGATEQEQEDPMDYSIDDFIKAEPDPIPVGGRRA